MSAQLDLWAPAQRPSVPRPVHADARLGRAPMSVDHSSYQPFDGVLARTAIIGLCRSAQRLVSSRTACDEINMHPMDLARLLCRLVDIGELAREEIYFGSSDPREKDYQGYQWGYKLPEGKE